MAMVEVNTGDLIGPALDWVMATIEELPIRHDPMAFGNTFNGGYWVWDDKPNGAMHLMIRPPAPTPPSREISSYYSPSTQWAQLGPLRDKYRVHICPIIYNDQQWDEAWVDAPVKAASVYGPTAPIAVCRAIALHKHGPRVSIPNSLFQQMTTAGGIQ